MGQKRNTRKQKIQHLKFKSSINSNQQLLSKLQRQQKNRSFIFNIGNSQPSKSIFKDILDLLIFVCNLQVYFYFCKIIPLFTIFLLNHYYLPKKKKKSCFPLPPNAQRKRFPDHTGDMLVTNNHILKSKVDSSYFDSKKQS